MGRHLLLSDHVAFAKGLLIGHCSFCIAIGALEDNYPPMDVNLVVHDILRITFFAVIFNLKGPVLVEFYHGLLVNGLVVLIGDFLLCIKPVLIKSFTFFQLEL